VACSEIVYEHCSLFRNAVGWKSLSFNTLNHVFIMLQIVDCAIGLYNSTCNVTVLGGSASNQTTCDFYSENTVNFSVRHFRSEVAQLFLQGETTGNVSVDNCVIMAPAHAQDISISLSRCNSFRLTNTMSEGYVSFTHYGNISIENCLLKTTSWKLPFQMNSSDPGTRLYYDCKNNRRVVIDTSVFSPMPDRRGLVLAGVDTQGNNRLLRTTFATSGTKAVTFKRDITVSVTSGSSTVTIPSGTVTFEDIGRKIVLDGVGPGATNLENWIEAILSATTIKLGYEGNYLPASTNGSVSAHVGEDEPDANYSIRCSPSANETISWSSKATTGFTLTSSNGSSTALVDIRIER
jgi:hypothetical protein